MEVLEKFKIDWLALSIMVTVMVGAFFLSMVLRWLISNYFKKQAGKNQPDPTRTKFLKNSLSFVIWLIAIGTIISFVPKLKSLAITLFAGAGILIAIIGFAAQHAFSNIISGIFIIIFKPFRIGDLIKVGAEFYGFVEDITLRHTVILNYENKRIIVPNAVISAETIINDSIGDETICRLIDIGISYDSDIELATQIIQDVALSHPSCINIEKRQQDKADLPPVEVRLISFGDFSVNLRAFVWTDDPSKASRMHSDINKALKKRFDLEGIEIPFPYRTVVYKNELPTPSKAFSK